MLLKIHSSNQTVPVILSFPSDQLPNKTLFAYIFYSLVCLCLKLGSLTSFIAASRFIHIRYGLTSILTNGYILFSSVLIRFRKIVILVCSLPNKCIVCMCSFVFQLILHQQPTSYFVRGMLNLIFLFLIYSTLSLC